MKSRGIYETPGGAILLDAHRGIESITLDRGAAHLKDELMPRLLRVAALSAIVIAVFAGGTYLLWLRTPSGFLPEEDQGAIFFSVQLPDGASVARTSETAGQLEKLMLGLPQVAQTFSVIGYSFLDQSAEPNAAFLVVHLSHLKKERSPGTPPKPWWRKPRL